MADFDEENARYEDESPHTAIPTTHNSLLPPEFLNLQAFKRSTSKEILFHVLSFISFPVLTVICKWRPRFHVFLNRIPVSSFRDAEYILLEGSKGQFHEVKTHTVQLERIVDVDQYGKQQATTELYRWFEYRKQKYYWSEQLGCYTRHVSQLRVAFETVHSMKTGLTSDEVATRYLQDGSNTIEIESVPIHRMIQDKILHPFYQFQIASAIIWFYGNYITYATLIVAMSTASIIWEIRSAKMNEGDMRNMIEQRHVAIVVRDGVHCEVDSSDLVTGDLVVLSSIDTRVVCDMVVVEGEVVADESSLTGETVPVVKSPLPQFHPNGDIYTSEKQKNHTLFGGSTIVQVKKSSVGLEMGALAIVVATGFSSTRGEMFRTILFPKPMDFKFNRDSYQFMMILGVVALISFLNRLVDALTDGRTFGQALLSSLDLITIAVPPALPVVLTIGIGFSMTRLKAKQIFCINPERVNYAGRINTFCWDKTGTLTASALRFAGLARAQDSAFSALETSVKATAGDMERVMITCHNVNLVQEKLVGHSVDLEMFKATSWSLKQDVENVKEVQGRVVLATCYSATTSTESESAIVEATANPFEDHPTTSSLRNAIHIIQRHDFDAALQRMSVVCIESASARCFASAKGSPEAIRPICRPSTIPSDYHVVYQQYASMGLYVLALAEKDVSLNDAIDDRRCIEHDMKFVGFIMFDNPIKKEASKILKTLDNAQIKSVIITGDNADTAIHVARELKMIFDDVLLADVKHGRAVFHPVVNLLPNHLGRDEESMFDGNLSPTSPLEDISKVCGELLKPPSIVMTGSALEMAIKGLDKNTLLWLIRNTKVFARAKPMQKSWIVEQMQSLGMSVGACGDGTNDCGNRMLKAADIGIALSNAEASIVAPFTSANKSIEDVPILLAEGRCALETSFTAFKYMILYPIIQLMMAASLNQIGSTLSSNQYLFDDLAIVLVLALLMLYTGPAKHLIADRPTEDLFSPIILASIGGQILICVLFYAGVTVLSRIQPWFCPTSIALSRLNLDTWQPVDPSADISTSYPCYFINPPTDVSFADGLLISSQENVVTWLFTHFQYVIVALAFSVATSYRKPFYTNLPYLAYMIFISAVLTMIAQYPSESRSAYFLNAVFSLRAGLPRIFRLELITIAFAQMLVAVLWELVVVERLVRMWVRKRQTVAVETAETHRVANIQARNMTPQQMMHNRSWMRQASSRFNRGDDDIEMLIVRE
ncbi:hypothetical protein SmJEL517_g04278 [Synchytrium microbalum]|uniref:Cation-transporting ATPase n=1 Tax=Synchytrium microbalum TaxID=1806994 RepID=A0A507C3F3_9FUNG|nr:uncharacterized protein SmJEL517_g04278 [Synchytrium microbalum]TPX32624.1 hypothetical protein SmJEL517_g04278 [Synchytrium microbalum]